ncbi:uncharacterized protein H6S33_006030 [Morchella sextelata]|uniref:uncharacterized protein n=1 Tax=Morchella sextelata TaxID=1174677 RepID=UPI001D056622|nr:uncharacterized protein H6S33_006030 [Morchella sextelata]KAH0614144.1 hypothetical protein H6S33_006030 [Morchella sextelata]
MESSPALPVIDRAYLAPPSSEDFDAEDCPSTPPAQLLSPQPRTPRPTRFLSPPRTPLAKLFTNFPTAVRPYKKNDSNNKELEDITRPESSCSNYSSSSDSSFDSLTTFTTTGGSCTSPETESSFFPDEATPKEHNDARKTGETGDKRKSNAKSRLRKIKWTEDMDGHLWRTYVLCQQDPKITPFFVLPGQVPPLGVCHKVAREAKRSWKEAKMGDGWKGPLTRQKRFITPAKDTGASGNRGDVLRKTSPHSWPASEGSTRKRLRELCRQNYGPSRNPHHGYHQQRRPTSTSRILPSRGSTVSPSPYQPTASNRLGPRDALFSTRGIALSLTTSTASTMNPNGVLAAIAAGYDVDADMAIGSRSSGDNFGGVSGWVSGVNNNDQGALGFGAGSFVNMGPQLGSGGSRFNVAQNNTSLASALWVSGTDPSLSPPNGSAFNTPVLLPPLELSISASVYGTWPRRQKRQEEPESSDESVTLPPPRRARRGTIGDLFGEPVPVSTAPRTRTRGYTIGSSCGNSMSRRRYRPLAPLLTVTGPVSYDSPNDNESLSPLASREMLSDPFRDSLEGTRNLGSPFVERKDWKGKKFDGPGELSSALGDEDLSNDSSYDNPEVGSSLRPVKRARE